MAFSAVSFEESATSSSHAICSGSCQSIFPSDAIPFQLAAAYALHIRYFSAFSGIGGFELALAGHHCVGFSEIDKHALRVYGSHFPSHVNYGDIARLDPGSVPRFDLLVGGFPCQPFSVAGRRLGFADASGTLFFDLARILQAKAPRYFIFENVKGLLSHDAGRTFKTIVAALVELGYDLQWQVLNSRHFGVPQNRERLFLVGHSGSESRPEVFPLAVPGPACPAALASTTIDANYGKGIDDHGARTAIIDWGNSAVVGEADWCRPSLREERETKLRRRVALATGVALKSRGVEPREDGLACCLKASESGTKNLIIHRFLGLEHDPLHSDNTMSACSVRLSNAAAGSFDAVTLRRLTPTECERLQGFPDGFTGGISDTQRYRCLGNAVTVPVVKAVVSRLRGGC